jgi:hypothetical protein
MIDTRHFSAISSDHLRHRQHCREASAATRAIIAGMPIVVGYRFPTRLRPSFSQSRHATPSPLPPTRRRPPHYSIEENATLFSPYISYVIVAEYVHYEDNSEQPFSLRDISHVHYCHDGYIMLDMSIVFSSPSRMSPLF